MLIQAEGLANDAPNTISFDGPAGQLRRYGHAETRMAFVVLARSHGEEPVPHAPAARMYSFELGLPPQAPLRGKSESPC
jgi:hypothetical protein